MNLFGFYDSNLCSFQSVACITCFNWHFSKWRNWKIRKFWVIFGKKNEKINNYKKSMDSVAPTFWYELKLSHHNDILKRYIHVKSDSVLVLLLLFCFFFSSLKKPRFKSLIVHNWRAKRNRVCEQFRLHVMQKFVCYFLIFIYVGHSLNIVVSYFMKLF